LKGSFATRFSTIGFALLKTLRLNGELPARAVDAHSNVPKMERSFILQRRRRIQRLVGWGTSLYPTAVFEHFLNDGISVGRPLTLYPVKKELAKGACDSGSNLFNMKTASFLSKRSVMAGG
jgi:hypothetical protein